LGYTTSARPGQVAEIFPRTFETGIKHGTITVLVGRQGYEITTFRVDGAYLDSRRPESVTFTTNIEEDLSRRDFTMNAIAYSPKCGFVDPFGGQTDIGKKIIRCVGDAGCRFGEDALRMLRAVRFAGQLRFTIDNAVLSAIKARKKNLSNISAERIRDELVKLLTSPHITAVNILESTGLLPYVLAGHVFGSDLKRTVLLLANCPTEVNLRLAIFLAFSGSECGKILRDMRFDNKTIRDVSLYVSLLPTRIMYNRYEIKKYLRQMSQAQKDEECPRQTSQTYFENLLTLQSIVNPCDAKRLTAVKYESRDIQTSGECYTLRDLSVNGEDLVAAGIPRGIKIGHKLNELLDIVMRDPTKNNFKCIMQMLTNTRMSNISKDGN